jgi:hypothetical protein
MLEVIGEKYAFLLCVAICKLAQRLSSEIHLSGNYIGTTHPPSATAPDTN